MDELLKELRTYLADTRKREQAADQRHRELVTAVNGLTEAVAKGLQVISHNLMDAANSRR